MAFVTIVMKSTSLAIVASAFCACWVDAFEEEAPDLLDTSTIHEFS
jgi:hypothetical protein